MHRKKSGGTCHRFSCFTTRLHYTMTVNQSLLPDQIIKRTKRGF